MPINGASTRRDYFLGAVDGGSDDSAGLAVEGKACW